MMGSVVVLALDDRIIACCPVLTMMIPSVCSIPIYGRIRCNQVVMVNAHVNYCGLNAIFMPLCDLDLFCCAAAMVPPYFEVLWHARGTSIELGARSS
ncbi:hypothetical protein BC629DRAFT_1477825 [Irpex lacteus]|nr:hypothetical protein BC629DRAFT_1477825 [Irpex lacteus]